MTRPLLVLALLALPGCEFWQEPPPDPALDGLLSCDEEQPLDGLVSGDSFAIDPDTAMGLVIATRFTDPDAAAILRIDAGDVRQDLGEWWDPVAGATRLSGSVESGMTAVVDLFAADGVDLGGSLVLTCPALETCWNLGDDNGDGLIDCADPQCARFPGCVTDQDDLETLTSPACDTWIAIDPPTIGPLDDQRTLYSTFPLGQVQPVESWWSGAEVRVPLSGVTTISARADTDGLLCVGEASGETVLCSEVALLEGAEVTVNATGTSAWLEPLGASWSGLEVFLACEGVGR